MVRCEPLSWYVEKLERGEPFTSLLYGDGEAHVITGDVVGQPFTPFKEVVTPRLVEEMRASLTAPGDDIIRGTDPFVIAPETYTGRDVGFFEGIRRRFLDHGADMTGWVDGTVWDVAAREGRLGPLLKALAGRNVVLVANQKLVTAVRPYLNCRYYYVPESNAAGVVLLYADDLIADYKAVTEPVFVLCCGLSAVPLGIRLRNAIPGATVMDLGSCLDVFAGIGAQRGWRAELYADPPRLAECIRRNLEGLDFDPDVPDPLSVAVPYLDGEPGWIVLGGLGNGREAAGALARWPSVRLIGIDPDPRALAWQQSNGWPEGMPLLQAALSDSCGGNPIYLADLNCASLHPAQLATALPGEIGWTDTVTLDALDTQYGFTDAILWLDLEDYEYKALCGAERLLASGRVLLVNVEVRYGREEVSKLRDLLTHAGYTLALTWFRQWWGHNELWRRV